MPPAPAPPSPALADGLEVDDLTIRYGEGIESVEGDAAAALQAQAPKRVAIHFHPKRVATWDHGKLGGTYQLGAILHFSSISRRK